MVCTSPISPSVADDTSFFDYGCGGLDVECQMMYVQGNPELLQELSEMNIRKILSIRMSENWFGADGLIGYYSEHFEGSEIELYFESVSNPNLKELGMKYCLSSEPFQTITFSNPSIEVLHLLSLPEGELDIRFKKMLSLKEVYLRYCTLSFDFLSSFPEMLHKLSIGSFEFTESTRHDVNLPTQLQSLVIKGNAKALKDFKIANINKLVHLTDFSIFLVEYDFTDYAVNLLINSLPSSVNRANLLLGNFEGEINSHQLEGPKLFLNKHHCLEYLSYCPSGYRLSEKPTPFDLSCLPPSHHLELGPFQLKGQF
ncbi:unnamed protein product [Ambrosiozyma monospora]|uniref:Unnamed protein product n=1 Tax=Ambrosiozyma monospora TaxID=43982 RepID=A0ACB5SYC2_AMBMO|nr:unnamed protein product [Ambrosiozyma monospora]